MCVTNALQKSLLQTHVCAWALRLWPVLGAVIASAHDFSLLQDATGGTQKWPARHDCGVMSQLVCILCAFRVRQVEILLDSTLICPLTS